MAHVAQYKKDTVKKVAKLIEQYPIVGAVNMENLPASALQKMRASLRGKAEIFMLKRRLINIAIEEAEAKKPGIKAMVPYVRGMPALLFTKENPFAIYKIIKQSKSPAPAKAGQIAPRDIEVKAGATPFMPGPIIGELGAIGIKSGVENGKVAIKADKIVVEEGEVIKANVASLLTRLGIEPMELGLDITAMYEKGIIYDRKVLDVDEKQFMANMLQAASWARNLAMEIAYPCNDTIADLLAKAYRETKAVGIEANIPAPEIINDLLAKAERQAAGVKQAANI